MNKFVTWGRWALPILILVVLGGVVGWGVLNNTLGPRRGVGTRAAQMNCLASIHAAQFQFREACYVDQDGDGVGEFGFLSELAGLDGRRMKGGKHEHTVPLSDQALDGRAGAVQRRL